MRIRELIGIVALGALAGPAMAQSLEQTSFLFRRQAPCEGCASPVTGPVSIVPTDPSKKDQAPMVDNQAFAQAPASGAEAGTTFNPAMFGDLAAFGNGLVIVRGGSSSFPTFTTVRIPVATHGVFKISDKESPAPSDRVIFAYNYYNQVSAGGGNPTFNLNRESIGFEKTFFSGNASFGMRVPFLQASSGGDLGGGATHEIGDITLITKYALINNRETGNVVSGGLALTVPSADHTLVLADGVGIRSVLFQPYTSWIYNMGDFYFQGFHGVVISTDGREVTELNNDVAVGFWAYRNRDGFLRGVVPTLEGHLFTPLNHRNDVDIITAVDIFTLTAGVTFVLPGNSTLGAGVAVPLTGPRPDTIEALVAFNFRF